MSFSTGFTSTRDDSVNAERTAEAEIEMEIILDGHQLYGCQVKGKSPVIIQKDFHGQQEDSP